MINQVLSKALIMLINKHGLIRLGGRLEHSSLEYDSKHPYILPKDCRLSTLVVTDGYQRTLHGSTQIKLATIRQNFWILGGRPTVKKELLNCTVCARNRAERVQ